MDKRTLKQNRAAHLFFKHLSNELNGKGLDMRLVLKPTYRLMWDEDSVKENLFKPLAKALYGVESTTSLTTAQINRVHEQLMLLLSEKFPEMDYVDWPSEENTESYYQSLEEIQ